MGTGERSLPRRGHGRSPGSAMGAFLSSDTLILGRAGTAFHPDPVKSM